jgi:hypothetical protein
VLFDYDPGPLGTVGPSNVRINAIVIERRNDDFRDVMTKKQLEEYVAHINTMYKRKDKKVLPANVPLPDGINPGGGINHTRDLPYDTTVPRGSRLTPERLATMNIGTNFLSPAEKQIFIDILFDFEDAIAFDDSEIGLLHPEIEPPVVIHTIPHSP